MKTGIDTARALILLGFGFGLAAVAGVGCTQNLPKHRFTIIYTNDVHGEFELCG